MHVSIVSAFRYGFVALLLAGSSVADVWVVDEDGSEDFIHVQDAVDAALDGDTILVKRRHADRESESVVVDGKGLTLLAFDSERLPIGSLILRNLGPDQAFVLSGFRVLTLAGLSHPVATDPFAVGILLENNSGSIRIQDCTITGTEGRTNFGIAGPGAHGVEIRSSEDVVISNCNVSGGEGYEDPNDGGFGLETRNSVTRVYNSTVGGGHGGHDIGYINDSTGGNAGDGVRAIGGTLGLVGCTVSGGIGGSGGGFSYSYGGSGGNGLSLLNGAAVHTISGSLSLGAGGFGLHSHGADGVDLRGRIVSVAGELPELAADLGFAFGGRTVELRVSGTPGDSVSLLLSRRTVAIPITPEQGVQHTAASERVDVGVIPASGEIVHAYSLPGVASGASLIHIQAETRQGMAPPRLSNPFALTALGDDQVPQCGLRVYVNQAAPPGGDGRSWATAYDDLQLALNAQEACSDEPTEVWVAEGTYRPTLPAGDRTLSFRLLSGVHLYGGFAGTETHLSQRNLAAHPVVLTGDLNGDDLSGFQNRSDNSRHVVQTGSLLFRSSNVRLDGVTVRGGEGIVGNGEDGGAGIYSRCNGLLVARCTVEDNRTAGFGDGAGLLQWRSGSTTVVESLFQGNVAGGSGGGLRIRADDAPADVHISNCVVRGNTAGDYGGGLYLRSFGGSLSGTTVYANAAEKWGGVSVAPLNSFLVANCVAWGNSDTLPASNLFEENFECPYPAWTNLRNSCVEGWEGLGGPTNTSLDPQFADPFGIDGIPGTRDDDLRLAPFSPCIDAGRNSVVLADVADLNNDGNLTEPTPTDLDHLRRFADDPSVSDSGNGVAPIVDMGAFEHRAP